MTTARTEEPPVEKTVSTLPRLNYRYIVLIGFCAVTLLALFSYDDRDSMLRYGGTGADAMIHNWFGRSGAWFSRTLLLSFGLGSFLSLGL